MDDPFFGSEMLELSLHGQSFLEDTLQQMSSSKARITGSSQEEYFGLNAEYCHGGPKNENLNRSNCPSTSICDSSMQGGTNYAHTWTKVSPINITASDGGPTSFQYGGIGNTDSCVPPPLSRVVRTKYPPVKSQYTNLMFAKNGPESAAGPIQPKFMPCENILGSLSCPDAESESMSCGETICMPAKDASRLNLLIPTVFNPQIHNLIMNDVQDLTDSTDRVGEFNGTFI